MHEFLQSYSKFAPLILDFIQEFRLFLAPIEGNRRIRQRMEAAITHNLNSQNGVVSIFKTTMFDMRQGAPEEPMKIKITSPARIMGLENELEIYLAYF